MVQQEPVARSEPARRCRSALFAGCSWLWTRIVATGRVVAAHPSILIWPLLALGLILGLGIWGVERVRETEDANSKMRATNLAQDAASTAGQQLAAAIAPVSLLAAMVQYDPQWAAASRLFAGLTPAVAAQSLTVTGSLLQLAPQGVIRASHPGNGSELYLGLDVFNSTWDDRNSSLKAVTDRKTTVVGPAVLLQGDYAVIVRLPVFLANVSADQDWGLPDPPPAQELCGAPCAYDAATRTKFWGFAQVVVPVDYLTDSQSRLTAMAKQGYRYQVLANDFTEGGWRVVSTNAPEGSLNDFVEVVLHLPNAEWVLRVSTVHAWGAGWYAGFIALVVVLAVAVSGLLFAVLVSRRQNQMLLEAVLPKAIIRELRKEDTGNMEARVLQADTPADMMLAMMGDLLEGYQPDVRDVVFIRTALMRNLDIYRPLNLKGHLRGSSLDPDVVQNLMQQLGNVGELDALSSYQDTIQEGDEGGGGGGSEAARALRALESSHARSSGNSESTDTVAGALTLLFTVQPYDPAGLSAYIHPNMPLLSRGMGSGELDASGGGALSPELAQERPQERSSAQDRPSGGGRWRNRKGLFLSTNGRPLPLPPPAPSPASLPSGPAPTLAVPASVLEETERLLAMADGWQFDTWRLQEATQGHALSSLGFFLMQRAGLVKRFRLRPVVLARFLRAVEGGYLDNSYHNATHAADVLQTLHVIIHAAQLHVHYLDPLGLLAAYYAAIVHDYAHPGLTSDFLVATSDPLAIRYNDKSPLENHHCAASFSLLQRPDLDILAQLSQAERTTFRKQVIELVLATDMKQHFSILSHFNTVHRGAPAPQPVDDTERLLSLQVALKCADIGHLGEELPVHKRWLSVLEEEFFRQGDREKELGLPISPLFDRSKQGVSKSQVGFYDFVALPLVHALASAFPGAQPLVRCFMSNYNHWRVVDGHAPVELPKARSGRSAPSPQATGLLPSVSSRFLAAPLSTPKQGPSGGTAPKLEKSRPPPLMVSSTATTPPGAAHEATIEEEGPMVAITLEESPGGAKPSPRQR
ncbi:hypothetical protein HYH03_011023 [Edaphochlamys debaryana]|uniref:Phosphodiesterase n=1 Tax=Edaphochlamys debaryana TaxID=47281 RepID=A0A836BW43_9CHLO|nr:hypothetical protein HYH03_011023 [Edaphochlamys debaryana]|eukprot:KAG2490632.1 hypothetical protein HYH03_011023 [Edaphochlamys debaryana]